MSLIRSVARKELQEIVRDGRLRLLGAEVVVVQRERLRPSGQRRAVLAQPQPRQRLLPPPEPAFRKSSLDP